MSKNTVCLWFERAGGATMKIAAAILVLLALAGRVHAQGRDAAQDDAAEGRRMEAEQQRIAARIVTHGEVCPDPAQPCVDVEPFHPNELSFRLHSRFEFDRGEDRSQPFYAVILKSAALCSIADGERLAVQAGFPARKVFVHQLHCGGFGDKATYTNVNRKVGFIGVYAGATEAEAQGFLAEVKAGARFPGANLRRMRVALIRQLE